jgi:hypothetical protein
MLAEVATHSARWLVARCRSGGRAEWVTGRGSSMAPWLHDGDELLVQPISDGRGLLQGDVVVACVGQQLVAHRLCAVEGGMVTLRGDGCRGDDPRLPVEALLGRVVDVRRRPLARRWAARARRRVRRWLRG